MPCRQIAYLLPMVAILQMLLVCITASAQDVAELPETPKESLYSYPNRSELTKYLALKANVRAQQELDAIVNAYDRVVLSALSDGEKLKALRPLGIRKVRLYTSLNITQEVMGIPRYRVGSYLNAWNIYWQQADRANIPGLLSKSAPGRAPTVSLRFSPAIKSLLDLGVDSLAFERALSTNPHFLGFDPDQQEAPGCEEYHHSGKYVGGGYTVDDRGVMLIDSCSQDGKLIRTFECVTTSDTVSPTPSPSQSPDAASAVVRAVARAKVTSCACMETLTSDKVKTAICR
jgi:hypothetical protein